MTFRQLYMPIHATLYKTALAILRDHNHAEDALQDALLLGVKNFGKLRDEQYFKTWMTRILINVCNDYRKPDTLPLDIAIEIPAPDNNQDHLHLLDCLEKLDSKSREIIVLRFWSRLSQEEIAETLKLPLGTVKSRLSRALRKMRYFYEDT